MVTPPLNPNNISWHCPLQTPPSHVSQNTFSGPWCAECMGVCRGMGVCRCGCVQRCGCLGRHHSTKQYFLALSIPSDTVRVTGRAKSWCEDKSAGKSWLGFKKVPNFPPPNYSFLKPLPPPERLGVFFLSRSVGVYAVAGGLDFKMSEVPNVSPHQLFPAQLILSPTSPPACRVRDNARPRVVCGG